MKTPDVVEYELGLSYIAVVLLYVPVLLLPSLPTLLEFLHPPL
jgi:hypothetical protein